MKKVYFPLSTEYIPVETEGSFLAASGVAECVINPVTVSVKEFNEVVVDDATIGDLNFE